MKMGCGREDLRFIDNCSDEALLNLAAISINNINKLQDAEVVNELIKRFSRMKAKDVKQENKFIDVFKDIQQSKKDQILKRLIESKQINYEELLELQRENVRYYIVEYRAEPRVKIPVEFIPETNRWTVI